MNLSADGAVKSKGLEQLTWVSDLSSRFAKCFCSEVFFFAHDFLEETGTGAEKRFYPGYVVALSVQLNAGHKLGDNKHLATRPIVPFPHTSFRSSIVLVCDNLRRL